MPSADDADARARARRRRGGRERLRQVDLHQLAVGRRRAFDERRVEAGIIGLRAAVAGGHEQLVVVAVRAELRLVHRVEHVIEVLVLQDPPLEHRRADDRPVLVEPVHCRCCSTRRRTGRWTWYSG